MFGISTFCFIVFVILTVINIILAYVTHCVCAYINTGLKKDSGNKGRLLAEFSAFFPFLVVPPMIIGWIIGIPIFKIILNSTDGNINSTYIYFGAIHLFVALTILLNIYKTIRLFKTVND